MGVENQRSQMLNDISKMLRERLSMTLYVWQQFGNVVLARYETAQLAPIPTTSRDHKINCFYKISLPAGSEGTQITGTAISDATFSEDVHGIDPLSGLRVVCVVRCCVYI